MDELFAGVSFWHWLLVGMICMGVEMFAPGAFFLGLGLAALVMAGLLWAVPDLSWQVQLFGFAVLALVSILGMRRYFKARPIISEQPLLNQRGAQYVGRTFTLAEPIVNGQGKIKVDDSTWKVYGEDCVAGTRIIITGVDGVVLKVQNAG